MQDKKRHFVGHFLSMEKENLKKHFETFGKNTRIFRLENKERYKKDIHYKMSLCFYSDNSSAMRKTIWEKIPYDNVDFAEIRDNLHDKILNWMNDTRDPFRGYHWERREWRDDARSATWDYTGMTRQRENDEYEPRQLDYDTGLPIKDAVRKK